MDNKNEDKKDFFLKKKVLLYIYNLLKMEGVSNKTINFFFFC